MICCACLVPLGGRCWERVHVRILPPCEARCIIFTARAGVPSWAPVHGAPAPDVRHAALSAKALHVSRACFFLRVFRVCLVAAVLFFLFALLFRVLHAFGDPAALSGWLTLQPWCFGPWFEPGVCCCCCCCCRCCCCCCCRALVELERSDHRVQDCDGYTNR